MQNKTFLCFNLRLNTLFVSIIVPPEGYLTEVQKLCKAHNVLLICDEIQTVSGVD